MRGNPDGLDSNYYSNSSPLSETHHNHHHHFESNKQEELFVKKGWLMRQGSAGGKEWFKHWFVLRNNSLTYYRDPSGEDSGILHGVLDLSLIKTIDEVDAERNYGFSITVS